MTTSKFPTEKLTLVFDLSHIKHDVEFTLRAGGGRKYKLTHYREAPHKLALHKEQNKVLSLIPETHHHKLTHFAEEVEMPAHGISFRSIIFPSLDDHPLPEVACEFVHIPTHQHRKAIELNSWHGGNVQFPIVLHHLGITEEHVQEHDMDELRLHAAAIKAGPAETARTQVFYHPEILTVDPNNANKVFDNHIKNSQDFQDLVEYISLNGPGSKDAWYQKTWTTWINPDTGKEEPWPAQTDIKDSEGKTIEMPDNPEIGKPGIPQMMLSDETNSSSSGVLGALTPVVQQLLIDTKNDPSLNGSLWTKQGGTTENVKTNVPPDPALRGADSFVQKVQLASGATKGWSIKNQTSQYGLKLYPDELNHDPDTGQLTFPVKNWPNRYLGAYVQFYTQDGAPIKRADIPGWKDKMPEFLRGAFEPSDSKNFVDFISSGNQIFGIPFYTSPTNIDFKWPQDATHADVLIGGFGVAGGFKDWDGDVDVLGTVCTGIINYGWTFISMGLGVYVVTPLMSMITNTVKYAIIGIAGGIAGVVGIILTGIETSKGTGNTGKSILLALASKAAGFLIGYGARKILSKVFADAIVDMTAKFWGLVTAEEALEMIPIAGRILQLVSIAGDVATLAATTIECLASPATYKLQILHTMDLEVEVGPDPTHGKDGVSIWPLVADHYVIQVKYPKPADGSEGGTTYTQVGPMPGDHSEKIKVKFEGIPAGGKCEVVANIYSINNWLAGRWDSGWIKAQPDGNDALSVRGNIKENLVPLTPTTSYSQKQRMIYDTKKQSHIWDVTQFTLKDDLKTALDQGNPDPLKEPFEQNGNTLPADNNQISITVKAAGSHWTLKNLTTATVYDIRRITSYTPDGIQINILEVQDTTHAIPPIPDVINACTNDGNNICKRVNMTLNNQEYQLGYSWQASGMNLPMDFGDQPSNNQMFAFQVISTLAQPEDWIIEPTRGFSGQPFIAFDQFGLASLFYIDFAKFHTVLNTGGAVPSDLAKEFGSYPLPPGAVIVVDVNDVDWTIGVPDEDPLYELRSTTEAINGNLVKVIKIYSYPVPKLDNFWLDPRPTPGEGGKLYHLRGVKFKKGKSTFNYQQGLSWGAFTVPNLDGLAVHPNGYVIGVEWGHEKQQSPKMYVLRLPREAVDDAKAPIAMPLSGFGEREGLMSMPQAMTVTSDGRVLILEQGNQRIQSFDTHANPVQSFNGALNFEIDTSLIPDPDGGGVTKQLEQVFHRNVYPWHFAAPNPDPDHYTSSIPGYIPAAEASSATGLDDGKVDADLVKAFTDRGYKLPEDASKLKVEVVEKGKIWTLINEESHGTYDLRLMTDPVKNKAHLLAFWASALSVKVLSKGQEWQIEDTANVLTYSIKLPTQKKGEPAPAKLKVRQLISTMSLRDLDAMSYKNIKYQDIAVETKGFVYVLINALTSDGSVVYMLDIYNPDGTILLDKPQTGVNAAKMAVDQWRNLFTLNLDKILGPGTRTEPGVSTWIPSTPGSPS